MKIILTFSLLLIAATVYAQSKQESQILHLSKRIFRLEISNDVDSLADIFDDQFMVITGSGDVFKRDQYLATLRSGNLIHNSIDVDGNMVTIQNSTATVVGKGKFAITISGNKMTMNLSYLEVFTKIGDGWNLLAIHFGVLPNQ